MHDENKILHTNTVEECQNTAVSACVKQFDGAADVCRDLGCYGIVSLKIEKWSVCPEITCLPSSDKALQQLSDYYYGSKGGSQVGQ